MDQISYVTPDDIVAICSSKNKEISELIVQWGKKFKFSKILRIVLLCVTIAAPVITALNSWRLKVEWIGILLNSLLSLIVICAATGILMLILKPVLYFIMRSAKKINRRISELEDELYALEFMMLDIDRPIAKHFNSCYKRYLKVLPNTYDTNRKIRALKMEQVRLAEWALVARGTFFIAICLIIVLAYLVFVVFIVVLILLAVCAYLDAQNNVHHHHRHYTDNNSDYDPIMIEDTLIAKLFFYGFQSTFVLRSNIKSTIQLLEKHISDRNEITDEFTYYGIPKINIEFYH